MTWQKAGAVKEYTITPYQLLADIKAVVSEHDPETAAKITETMEPYELGYLLGSKYGLPMALPVLDVPTWLRNFFASRH